MKVKVVYNQQIHLIKLQAQTLQLLNEEVVKKYPTLSEGFTLTYTDSENDQITISNQEDLQVLIEENQNKTIKIFVNEKKIISPPMIHRHHTCDGCQKFPIVGARHKCLECPDYDLCETCFAQNMHSNHKLYKISNMAELDAFRATYGCGRRRGPFGHQHHGNQHHGPFGFHHGFHHVIKQVQEVMKDPTLQDIKQNLTQIASGIIDVVQSEIKKAQNIQKQESQQKNEKVEESKLEQTQQQPQEVETQKPLLDEFEEQTQNLSNLSQIESLIMPPSDVKKVDSEFEEKVSTLASIVDCDEKMARDYVELFKDLPLEDIVDIIFSQK